MVSHLRFAVPTLLLLSVCASAQVISNPTLREISACKPKTAVEFIAPMPGEEIPNFHPVSPNPESWHVILEVAVEQVIGSQTPVFEAMLMPSPGAAAGLPTDVNGDTLIGDAHPAVPGLTLVIDDDLFFNGFILPAGTNLASFFEIIGSEIEHGGDQSTSLSWILDPQYMLLDLNGDMGTNVFATLNGVTDTVFVRHGVDQGFQGVLSPQNPTVSIWTADWISSVDSDTTSDQETPFLVGVEVRIPCFFDSSTSPPTPIPLDPVFGPCWGGGMLCTGNSPPFPGPGLNPMYPSLDVRFSDDYLDVATGSFVPGGVITGGQCGVIWGSTGGSVAFAFRQASQHAWFGVNGFPDTTPMGGGDDQLIYRFVMLVDGMILDTDALPGEMMITATVETTTNCFSITNVRVEHRPDVTTPNPGP